MHVEVWELRKQLEDAQGQARSLQHQLQAATASSVKHPAVTAAAGKTEPSAATASADPFDKAGVGCCFGLLKARTAKAAVQSAVHPA